MGSLRRREVHDLLYRPLSSVKTNVHGFSGTLEDKAGCIDSVIIPRLRVLLQQIFVHNRTDFHKSLHWDGRLNICTEMEQLIVETQGDRG